MPIVGGRNSVVGSVIGVAIVAAGNEITRQLASGDFEAGPFDLVLREGLTDICLDQGAVIAVGTPTELQANPKVQVAYLTSTSTSTSIGSLKIGPVGEMTRPDRFGVDVSARSMKSSIGVIRSRLDMDYLRVPIGLTRIGGIDFVLVGVDLL